MRSQRHKQVNGNVQANNKVTRGNVTREVKNDSKMKLS